MNWKKFQCISNDFWLSLSEVNSPKWIYKEFELVQSGSIKKNLNDWLYPNPTKKSAMKYDWFGGLKIKVLGAINVFYMTLIFLPLFMFWNIFCPLPLFPPGPGQGREGGVTLLLVNIEHSSTRSKWLHNKQNVNCIN